MVYIYRKALLRSKGYGHVHKTDYTFFYSCAGSALNDGGGGDDGSGNS